MTRLYETSPAPLKIFLAGFWDDKLRRREAESLLQELEGLALTLGYVVAGKTLVHRRGIQSALALGRGQAAEIAETCRRLEASCAAFDCDLSPSQQRNWEELCGITVIDRRELIIRIFARGARTREAALQIELAELRFRLPRLTHKYESLSRQRGGSYGAKGAGETRFETDRRAIENRVRLLEREIEGIRVERSVQRGRRKKEGVPVCALAGYTNSGKSSLLNRLSGANAYAADQLFATLDTTSRRVSLLPEPEDAGNPPRARSLILIDTVGFIRRLPHDLVSAFRSTLEEAAFASFLIHVLDASNADAPQQYQTTKQVLEELGAGEKPVITALNKIDKADDAAIAALMDHCPGAIPVSARTGAGLDRLLAAMSAAARTQPA